MTLSEKYKKMQDEMTNAVQAAANQQVQATAMTPAQTAAAATAATELARQKGAGAPQDYGTLADKYLNIYRNGQFNYDFNADPAWQNAKDAYMRQGQLAAKNVQAQAAALTGGYGNSYGAMAAQQQYNAALQNMNEIIPELEANAYNRYQADQNRNLTLAQMYMDLENQKYNRQMNEAQLAAQYGDYTGLNGLGINTEKYESKEAADQAWEDLTRERTMTEWDQADEDRATNIALQAAQYGDYSKLEKLGFDMSTQRQRDMLDEAIQKAQYSDYSGLKALGFDVGFLEAQKAAAWSKLYGTGSSGGGNGSKSKKDPTAPVLDNPEDDAQTMAWFNSNDGYDERAVLMAKDVALSEGNRNLSYDRNTNTVTATTKDGKKILYKYDNSSGDVLRYEV